MLGMLGYIVGRLGYLLGTLSCDSGMEGYMIP